jgi:site-specific DNA-cytosine methylase
MYKNMNNHTISGTNGVRFLHPIEAERLQVLPESYTASVSTSQRLKALGNGWNVPTIVHIFKNLKQWNIY